MTEKNSVSHNTVTKKDIEDNKVLAIIAYLGFLCLVPLLAKKDSPYAQFHGKQGLLLFILWIISNMVAIFPLIGWLVAFAGNIAVIVLMIVGILNAVNGEMKELPIVGEYAKKINI